MSFGSFKGGASIPFQNLITSSNSVGISALPVVIGDLLVGVFSETTSLTVTNCTDNIHGTTSSYTAQNAGTLSTSVSGRMFYKVATSSANLTSWTFNATSSAHSGVGLGVVYSGPFTSVPIGANPANVSDDLTTPFTATATGALTSSNQLVVGWASVNTSALAWVGVAPGIVNLIASPASASSASTLIQSYVISPGTSSIALSWTGPNPNHDVLGAATFLASSTPDVLLGTMVL